MYENIAPKLGSIYFFEENSFHLSETPVYDGDEWYIQGEFTIIDQVTEKYNKTKPIYKKRIGNKDGDLGHVFPFVMCSKGYADKHGDDMRSNGFKPIIMDAFGFDKATALISQRIAKAGENITIDRLWLCLSEFSDTSYDS